MSVERRELERLRYWQGQTLASRDFRDQLAHDAALRWWHNRAIHDAWGVVEGLSPRVVGEEVRVSPGIAYDGFGRELIVARPRAIAPPPSEPAERAWLLLLRAAAETAASRTPAAKMSPSPRSGAELVWVADGPALDPRIGVPLARGRHGDGVFELAAYQLGSRRGAGAVARPRLGSGATIKGRTDWRPWVLGRLVGGAGVGGIEVEIDTSAAGFERAPCYFAWLQGPRLFGSGGGPAGAPSFAGLPHIGFERILRARPDGFVFNLLFPPEPPFSLFALEARAVVARTSGVAALMQARRELSVCWLGIEARTPASSGSRLQFDDRRGADCRELGVVGSLEGSLGLPRFMREPRQAGLGSAGTETGRYGET